MKKSRIVYNLIFILIFMVLLIVPTVLMDHEQYKSSDIDNKTLTEWPGFSMDTETIRTIEDYVDDRIGFRSAAIYEYTKLSDDIFHVMVHPLFMYGEDGHIYYKDKDYVAAYQKLNTNPEYMDSLVNYLEKTNDYLKSRDIKFLYFLAPDKKSIYPEHFPKSVHVKEDETSVIEYMSSRLANSEIEYVIPYNELLKAKENLVVYNKKYDATHWNEYGSMIGQKLLDDHVQQWFDDVRPLSEADYSLGFEKRTNLDQSDFPIDDDVPVYTLISDTSQDAGAYLATGIKLEVPTFYAHYMNPEVTNGKRLVIFTDSYFATYSKFYTNRFTEVYYIHRQNYRYLQYIVNLLFPDAVIFETAERSITGEMPLSTELGDYYYEKSYNQVSENGLKEISKPADLEYSITRVTGALRDGNILKINPEDGASIVSMAGYIHNYEKTKDLDLYLLIDGNYLELDYDNLHKESVEDNKKYFEIDVQRRYLAPCEMQVIAVDETSGEQFVVETFTITYGE
ncbi:MAG: hypothetical protein Q4D29_04690 [Lachnospiraceae bacterium]|nr:hypothetical protein [Lachnospiraceae bacterium]